MIKRVMLTIVFIISCAAVLSAASDRFEKKKVAVIPAQEIPRLNSILEGALGTDKRFEFIDRKQIPAIMKEWEKRQTGLTGDDNSSELYLSNVDYLITVSNAHLTTDWIANKKGGGHYESKLSAQIKVTFVQDGGRTDAYSIKSSSSDANKQRSENGAIEDINSSMIVGLKKLFPIEAELYESDMTTVKLMRGSNTGIEEGQRYMIREKKIIDAGKKKITSYTDKAFVRINQVSDEDSSGYIIFGSSDFNLEKSVAKEKYYSGIAFELFAGVADYSMYDGPDVEHDFGVYDLNYGFRLLAGDQLQVGWGMNADFPGPGRFSRFSLSELSLRYNMHIFRRLYFMIEGAGSLEFSTTNEYVRTKSNDHWNVSYDTVVIDEYYITDIEERHYSWTIAGAVGGGFKFITGENTYVFTTVNYYFAKNANDWFWLEPTEDAEEGDPDMKAIYADRIEDVDDVIERFSPSGLRVNFGVGFYF